MHRGKSRQPEAVVIWVGRNNIDEPAAIERDVRAMVDALEPGSKFLVLGLINAADKEEQRGSNKYNLIVELNARLRAEFGERFVSIYEALMAAGNNRFAEDQENAKTDITPASLRFDGLHLNDAGQAVVAGAVAKAMATTGF